MRLRPRLSGIKYTDLKYGHHFVGVVVLGLLLSYLIWKNFNSQAMAMCETDRPRIAVPLSCSRSSELQNIGVSKVIGSDAWIGKGNEASVERRHAHQDTLTTWRIRLEQLPT